METPTSLLALAASLVDTLVEEKLGDDLTSFSFKDADRLAKEAGIHVSTIVTLGKRAGLTYDGREVPREVRGFRTSSNDRWFGPGACKTHGGSGYEQINGFAGQKG